MSEWSVVWSSSRSSSVSVPHFSLSTKKVALLSNNQFHKINYVRQTLKVSQILFFVCLFLFAGPNCRIASSGEIISSRVVRNNTVCECPSLSYGSHDFLSEGGPIAICTPLPNTTTSTTSDTTPEAMTTLPIITEPWCPTWRPALAPNVMSTWPAYVASTWSAHVASCIRHHLKNGGKGSTFKYKNK